MLACVNQGVEGPRGPPGGRGIPGEGLPGPKVGFAQDTHFMNVTLILCDLAVCVKYRKKLYVYILSRGL